MSEREQDGNCGIDIFLGVSEDQVHLRNQNIHGSMGLGEMHPRALREFSDVAVKPPSITSEKSWQSGEVPSNCNKRNIPLIFTKGGKEDPGNSQPIIFTSVPRQIWNGYS